MFPDQESAIKYLESRRWPNGVHCPSCNSPGRITKRKNCYYRCNACKKDFTVRTGTIFKRSHIPLHKWIYAIRLVNSGESITSVRLSKEIDVTQKSAWFLIERLKNTRGKDHDKFIGEILLI